MPVRLIGASMCIVAIWLTPQVPVGAYVNGGIFHSTFLEFERRLKSDGWSACFGSAMPSHKQVAQGVTFDPPDSPEFVHFVNQLVAKATRQLPEEKARAISIDTKHEIARLAREAILAGSPKGNETITKGKIGSLRYQVGAFAFQSYWETNYRRNGRPHREIHAARAGLVPFVALKVEDRNEGAE